ncbi:MAG TPA: hypothetical protein VN249_10020 [Prolixibacteraceae bacterium]|nr:hypothetical protein [Prolixibacteraceae bacterium]
MPKRIIMTLFILVAAFVARSQEKLNYAVVEQHSYQLWLDQNWEELIDYAGEARKQGIDFFYLQVRTGIALYNQRKYSAASKWFIKAYANDQSFEWLQEYLYYSLVYSGRDLEAIKYAPQFSDTLKNRIGFQERGVIRLAYEAGYSYNPEFEALKSRSFSTEVDLGDDYGEGNFLKNYSFHSFDLTHRAGKNLTINHNLTYVGVNRETVVDWEGQTSSPVRVNQFQYFINPVWVIGKKLNVSPAMSLIFGNGEVYAGRLTGNSTKIFSLTEENFNSAVFSMAMWSNFCYFSPGAEINTGKLNNSGFTQLSSWVTWYPLSNARLYITPRVYFKSGEETGGMSWNAFGLSGGAQLGKIFIYGQYLTGDMENFVESVGYVIDNFPGRSDQKIMGSIYLPAGKRCQLVFRYINQHVIEKYQVYTNGVENGYLEYDYLKHTFTGGISWNF